MSKDPQVNGSVVALGEAMYNVIRHAVKEGLEPVCNNVEALRGEVGVLRDDVGTLRGEVGVLRGEVGTLRDDVQLLGDEVCTIRKEFNDRIDTTNQNMQAQFAEQEKKIGRLIAGRIN